MNTTHTPIPTWFWFGYELLNKDLMQLPTRDREAAHNAYVTVSTTVLGMKHMEDSEKIELQQGMRMALALFKNRLRIVAYNGNVPELYQLGGVLGA